MSTKILIYPLKKCMCKELRERGLRPFFFAIKFSYFEQQLTVNKHKSNKSGGF
jgi:hypothetical protein